MFSISRIRAEREYQSNTMVMVAEEKILIREFTLSPKKKPSKKYSWTSLPLKNLLRKIDKTGDAQHYPDSGRPGTVRV